ncbi:bifunctional DNA primase/polymerase [Streptacidiphilus jiangxiensis]|uniref:Bifunctional DNA primase/polymerase, N-terminal n=1 Tax=Streptacidiphilus jiangxiensis TaxID=235985 RepID=A0A1H7VIE1_STRJI|nr:Bifunctional DNA primase/polymerase, N-terminal [Streptacidiphilus jiangxiensis]
MESAGKVDAWWRRWLRLGGRPDEADAAAERARRLRVLLDAARAGFPVAPAAHAVDFTCSCDRVGCPAPAQHPLSFAWQSQATTDFDQITRWLVRDPDANAITPTGRVHDVLDVPTEAGRLALERLAEAGVAAGPVAALGEDRWFFFTTTRSPLDEDEWWTSELDSHPDEAADEHPGLRWHTRGSYVLLPPSRLADGSEVTWVRGPDHPLPDPLRLLDVLTDACAEVGAPALGEQWLIR